MANAVAQQPGEAVDDVGNQRSQVDTLRYDISGEKLADLPPQFDGVAEGGKRYAGSTTPTLSHSGEVQETSTGEEADPGCPGGTRYTSTLTAEVFWSLSFVIRLPRWTDHGDAPLPAQTEWSRFIEAVRNHEEGHVAAAEASLKTAAPKTVFTGSGSGCTPAEARAAAQAAIEAKIQEEADRLTAAVNDASATYDEETDHGAKQGGTLDTTADNGGGTPPGNGTVGGFVIPAEVPAMHSTAGAIALLACVSMLVLVLRRQP